MRRPLLFCSFCLVILVAFGCCLSGDTAGGGPPDGTSITVTGKVCQKDKNSFVVKLSDKNISYISNQTDTSSKTVLDSATSHQKISAIYSTKLLCEYEAAENLILGSELVLTGDYYTFTPATNPGEFDYAHYYRSMGYAGRLKRVQVTAEGRCTAGVCEFLYRVRQLWQIRLYRIFPEKEASIMSAILLGDKSGLNEDIKELYRRNGIIHILSISGLHISLIGMGLYKLLRRMGAPVWFAALSGAVILILYGIMTGLSVSVCRAIGMYLIRMLAELLGRTYDMLTALGVVAVGMVCHQPAWLGHMGFLLSFGSILGVGALLPALSHRREEVPGLKRYVESKRRRCLIKMWETVRTGLGQSFMAGLSITLTTLPIQLWFSYEVPIYSVFLNVVILPFMSIVMAAGLIAMLIPGMGIVGTADMVVLAGYEEFCRLFERLPNPVWNPGRPQIWQMAAYYLLWAAAVWGGRQRGTKTRDARMPDVGAEGIRAGRAVGIAIALAAAVFIIGLPDLHGDRVTFLDVGQGDCICVQLSSGEVYLFDCGSSSRSRVGERVLIPFLKFYGIQRVDAVFASHGDADHINGILELLALREEEHIEVGQLVLPGIDRALWQEEFGELLEAAGEEPANAGNAGNVPDRQRIPVNVIRAGDSWTAGADYFQCLHPSVDGKGMGGNEGSESFYIELREGGNSLSLLLTGDVEGAGERQLLAELQERGIRDVTVFKVMHHGSRNSTSEEFLTQIRPVLSVISCGRNNRYGHPHGELLERLEAAGTIIYDTPGAGAVQVELGKTGAKVERFAED